MSTIVLAVVTVAGTFGFMLFMKRKLGTQYAHLRAGVLAPRLGMQLVEGNPEHNLATQSVLPSVHNIGSAGGFLKQMAAAQVGGTLGEFRLHMVGQPYGLDAELRLYVREDLDVGYTRNTTTTWSDLRMTVNARCNIAPFDVRLRQELTGLEAREPEAQLPAQRFHDPALDERLVITAYDPALPRSIAAALAPILPALAYVHITGGKNQVSFVMTPTSVMTVAASLEQILHALASIAAIFEGRPAPRAMVAAPMPSAAP